MSASYAVQSVVKRTSTKKKRFALQAILSYNDTQHKKNVPEIQRESKKTKIFRLPTSPNVSIIGLLHEPAPLLIIC